MKKSILILSVFINTITSLLGQNPNTVDSNKTHELFYEDLRNIQANSSQNSKFLKTGEQGKIKNIDFFLSKLTHSTGTIIDRAQPVFIFYFPGQDPCNTSGSATKWTYKQRYKKIERKINAIRPTTFLYIKKEGSQMLHNVSGSKKWIEDPDRIIENTFFVDHYPCSSFLVMDEDGDYISHFGEYSIEYAANTASKLLNKN